jgi:hypothetical protein
VFAELKPGMEQGISLKLGFTLSRHTLGDSICHSLHYAVLGYMYKKAPEYIENRGKRRKYERRNADSGWRRGLTPSLTPWGLRLTPTRLAKPNQAPGRPCLYSTGT